MIRHPKATQELRYNERDAALVRPSVTPCPACTTTIGLVPCVAGRNTARPAGSSLVVPSNSVTLQPHWSLNYGDDHQQQAFGPRPVRR